MIPAIATYVAAGIALTINIVFVLLQIFNVFPNDVIFGQIDNLIAGGLGIGIVYIIQIATRSKGIGSGDLILCLAVGLMLGWPEIISFWYVVVLSGAVVGVLYSLKLKKLKGVQIPLVPFIFFGFSLSLVLGSKIFELLFLRL